MNKLGMRGRFVVQHLDKDGNLKGTHEFPNGIVDVGLNHILETQFNGGTPVTTWYIGLINNAGYSALANADTMASHAGWAEITTQYDEATRPEWTAGTAAARSITNGTAVDFSMNDTISVRGIFITSVNTKGGTTGILWSTALFASTVAAENGDTLKVTYTVSG
jgi:hypothetical protein